MSKITSQLKAAVKELRKGHGEFVEEAVRVEEGLLLSARTAEAALESVQAEHDALRATHLSLQQELSAKTLDLEAIKSKESAASEQLGEQVAAAAKLAEALESSEAALEAQKNDLEGAVRMAEELSAEKDRLHAALGDATASHAAELSSAQEALREEHAAKVHKLGTDLAAVETRAEAATAELATLQAAHAKLVQESQEANEKKSFFETAVESLTLSNTSAEKQVSVLTVQLQSTKEALEQKGSELSMALTSLGDIQRATMERETKLRDDVREAEERTRTVQTERDEMRAELTSIKHEHSVATAELATSKDALEKAVAEREEKAASEALATQKLTEQGEALAVEKELRARAERSEEAERAERTGACAQLMAQTQAHEVNMQKARDEAKGELEVAEVRMTMLTATLEESAAAKREADERTVTLESEVKSLRTMLESEKSNSKELVAKAQLQGEMDALRHRLEEQRTALSQSATEAQARIAELEEEVRKGETQRRKMHNLIQELRGNVRVFARVRPFLPGDGVADDAVPAVTAERGSGATALAVTKFPGGGKGQEDAVSEIQNFKFDRVFAPSVGQEQVFMEVSEFVQSALDGYQVCLFSYGQTGSGKTHTMQGGRTGPMRGLIPRCIEQIGKYKETLETQGWQYTMEVTFVEIYNEQIRDLLRPTLKKVRESRSAALGPSPSTRACTATDSTPTMPHPSQGEVAAKVSHDIRTNKDGSLYISDVTRRGVEPTDLEEIDSILELAARQRSVGVTDMNAQVNLRCSHLPPGGRRPRHTPCRPMATYQSPPTLPRLAALVLLHSRRVRTRSLRSTLERRTHRWAARSRAP